MHLTRQSDLPFAGMSHDLVGADHGIEVSKAHPFVSVGPEPLIQFDIHLSPRFEQENLD